VTVSHFGYGPPNETARPVGGSLVVPVGRGFARPVGGCLLVGRDPLETNHLQCLSANNGAEGGYFERDIPCSVVHGRDKSSTIQGYDEYRSSQCHGAVVLQNKT